MPMLIGAVTVVIVGVLTINANKTEKVDYDSMTEEQLQVAVQEKIDKIEVNNLAGMGERDRMEYYVASFIKTTGNKEYEKAYNMLYDDFKERYFPTLSSFEKYASNKFPSMCSVEHTNFERNGEVYVMWVNLSDSLAGKDSTVEMNFVVKENDLNDFELSFKVN